MKKKRIYRRLRVWQNPIRAHPLLAPLGEAEDDLAPFESLTESHSGDGLSQHGCTEAHLLPEPLGEVEENLAQFESLTESHSGTAYLNMVAQKPICCWSLWLKRKRI